jgi:RNA recognition motif-containing protein
MQSSNDDGQHQLLYINGTPYFISPAPVQGNGQLQQVLISLQQQPQQQQQLPQHQDAMPAGFTMESMQSSAGQPTMTLLSMATAPRPSQQVLVLHSPAPAMELPTSSLGQTWVPVLANPSHLAYPDSGQQLPSYHTVVPSAAVPMEALQSVSVVSLPAASTASTNNSVGVMENVLLSDTPLHSLPTASRQQAEQCLQYRTIHQRGTARLFVGQIHYDACEDDLYQIFGVYGHVLDVKIMRSGDASNTTSTAAGPVATSAAAASVTSAASATVAPGAAETITSAAGDVTVDVPLGAVTTSNTATTNTPANDAASVTTAATAINGSESCNESTYLNTVKAESECSRICRSASMLVLPPTAPPPPLSTVAISATSPQAAIPAPSSNSNTNNTSAAISPPKSSRRCNAFVTFSSMIEADTAISALHGRYVMGRDRPLQVTYCQATENISQFGFAHAVRLHKENKNNPLPFKSGAPTHR